jgi:calcium-dependent protein kinase
MPFHFCVDAVGTVYTMAPEVLMGDYDQKVDIWSIGVIAFMLLSSSLPFYGKTRQHVLTRIISGKFSFKGRRWSKVSTVAMSFVEQLLVLNPKERPSAEEALKISWFEASFDEKGRASEVELDQVQAAMQVFAEYGRLKKLALLVIAYKSTDDEIGFLRKVFRKFDHIKNGEISLHEFKVALVDYKYTEEELEDMFEALDLDRTGSIHYSEFLGECHCNCRWHGGLCFFRGLC